MGSEYEFPQEWGQSDPMIALSILAEVEARLAKSGFARKEGTA
jgi:hypothetical protein